KSTDLQSRRTAEELLGNQITGMFPPQRSLSAWRELLKLDGSSLLRNVPSIARIATESKPDELKELRANLATMIEAVSGARDENWKSIQLRNLNQWSDWLANIREVRSEVERVTNLNFPADKQPHSATEFVDSVCPFRNLSTLIANGCTWLNDAGVRQLI